MSGKLNPKQAAAAAQLGAKLGAQSGKVLDTMRLLSQGKKGGKTFITEEQNAPTTTITITNDDKAGGTAGGTAVANAVANVLFINPVMADFLSDVYGSKAAFLEKMGATHIAYELEAAPEESPIRLRCNDQGRNLYSLLGYSFIAPIRFLSMQMESSRVSTGLPDSGNFSTNFKTVWWSPFHVPQEEFLPLRKFQNSAINSPQYLDVNFKKEGFPVLLGDQHFFVMSVRPGSQIVTTFTTGYAFDKSQYLYRSIKEADAVLPSFSNVGQ